MNATEIVEAVADGTLAPADGAAQINELLTGGIVKEAAADPSIDRLQALLGGIEPEITPGVISIIVTIKIC